MLFSLIAGVRGYTLIVNLPESAKACSECLELLSGVLKQAIEQLREDKSKVDKVGDSNVSSKVENLNYVRDNSAANSSNSVDESRFCFKVIIAHIRRNLIYIFISNEYIYLLKFDTSLKNFLINLF